MEQIEIKNIDTLIQPILDQNHTFVEAKLSKLTSAGDNYGSLILSLDVIIKNENEEPKHENLVAKMLPSNQFIQKMFNIEYTFRNEMAFYQTIVPCLREFQNEHDVDLFDATPTFCNARTSLKSNEQLDDNAVLLLRNIKIDGYTIIDRTIGFDLEPAKLILTKLAQLHAGTIGLKLQKPDIFNQKFKPQFKPFTVFELDEEANITLVNGILQIIKDDPICIPHMVKIAEILSQGAINNPKKNHPGAPESPFLSLVHGDLWCNNIMVKTNQGEITDIKFIDFQLYDYSCLTKDVILFLFTSVKIQVLQVELQGLLEFYYKIFIKFLEDYKCDVTRFSFDCFMGCIKTISKYSAFCHIMIMMGPIFARGKDAKEVDELGVKDMTHHDKEVSEKKLERALFIVHEFIRRKWLW